MMRGKHAKEKEGEHGKNSDINIFLAKAIYSS
jgi:hypothetical protein